MLTKDQLINVLAVWNKPYDFLVFADPQIPPYALVIASDTNNVSSDAETLEIVHGWDIELYYRTIEDREEFEQVLMDSHVVWDRYGTDTWIDSEQVFLSRYELP